jgi:phosphoribosylcarboxyaminoimidazole (NCAIR) mutase
MRKLVPPTLVYLLLPYLALSDPAITARLEAFRKAQAEKIKAMTLPELE